MSEYTNNFLEKLEFGKTNQPLVSSILISICWNVGDVSWILRRLEEDRNNVFTNSLTDTTM